MNPILEWALTIIGSGGIGAIITYIFTFKSKQKQANAEANMAQLEVEQGKFDLRHDQYDFLQETCDKYIRDYHNLEKEFREEITKNRHQHYD